jgi:hypothetical protein
MRSAILSLQDRNSSEVQQMSRDDRVAQFGVIDGQMLHNVANGLAPSTFLKRKLLLEILK